MYTYYRVEQCSLGQWRAHFLWDDLYATVEDARREVNKVINSGRIHPPLLRVVRYSQIGCGRPEREVLTRMGKVEDVYSLPH